ncbi:nucleoside deaminase [Candidatus Micrarchaeota archaeon CG08_land_8_20_14_0_20_49_17]|nr:MAG: nucleoside deaminase [Candidatus Micrarchaeota archaeon CG08_land_8_20_14_0_20_49_17]
MHTINFNFNCISHAMMPSEKTTEGLMRIAIAEARNGMRRGDGGPFGAVIAKIGSNGKATIVSKGHNSVFVAPDPTAHAEVVVIRKAAKKLGKEKLGKDYLVVATTEPCPMCAGAINWAGISNLAYGTGIRDAKKFGFWETDVAAKKILRKGKLKNLKIVSGVLRGKCLRLFSEYEKIGGKKY